MDAVLLILGVAMALAGLGLFGFGLSMATSTVGGLLITIGMTATVGGFVLVGLGGILQQLSRLVQALEAWPLPRNVAAEDGERQHRSQPAPVVPSTWLMPESTTDDGQSSGQDERNVTKETAIQSGGEKVLSIEPRKPASDWEERLEQKQAGAGRSNDDDLSRRGADNGDVNESASAPKILKSGVIDGMAYTLYVDGSIEAELPQGTVRFASLDELRFHLTGRH